MVTVNIVCVGGIKEKHYVDSISEYAKRLTKFCKLNIIEVAESKNFKASNLSEIDKIKDAESNEIKKHLKGYVVVLEVLGNQISSTELANKIDKISLISSTITFVIGGSYGLNNDIKENADYLLSFSKFTFPHQLMRVILVEQIYRAFTINNNITYHK